MRRELAATKEQIRKEIALEKEKAQRYRQQLQDELALDRENAARQKKQYADEVLEARQKSQVQMEESKRALADSIRLARANAGTQIEKINL